MEAVESDGSEDDEDKTVAAEAEGDDEDKDKTVAAESATRKLASRIKAMENREAARELAAIAIESAGCQMTRERVKDLAEITSPKIQKVVIDGWLAQDGGMSVAAESALPVSKPRSGLKPAIESARTSGKPSQSNPDEEPDVLSMFGCGRVPMTPSKN